ncbi:MAG: hypothetical protein NTZ05_00075 [Chloroflexi bacterium]|nr:hypothetical protein [Chloroflexota bacterium]
MTRRNTRNPLASNPSAFGLYEDTDRDTLQPIRVGVVDWPPGAQLPTVVDATLLRSAHGGVEEVSRLRKIRKAGRPPLRAVESAEAANKADVGAALKALNREQQRLEAAALRAKGDRAGELFNLAGELASARDLLQRANQTGRGRSAADLRAEKGARTRTEIEGLREAIAASPLMQHRSSAVNRLVELYRRPTKSLEEREMVSKRVATQLLGHAPNHAPGKGGLYNIHNLVDEIGDEAGFRSTDDVVNEARLLAELQGQITELERQLPRQRAARTQRKAANPELRAPFRFEGKLYEVTDAGRLMNGVGDVLLIGGPHWRFYPGQQPAGEAPYGIPRQLLDDNMARAVYARDAVVNDTPRQAAPPVISALIAAHRPNRPKRSQQRQQPPSSDQFRMFNPRHPSGHQVGFTESGELFSVPHHEESRFETPCAGGEQMGLAFGASDDLRLAPRVLTAEEERLANRGRLRPEIGQGRMFNPRAESQACPGCRKRLHIPAYATKIECGSCGDVYAVGR